MVNNTNTKQLKHLPLTNLLLGAIMKTYKVSYFNKTANREHSFTVANTTRDALIKAFGHLTLVMFTEVKSAPSVTIEPTDTIEEITLKGSEVKSININVSEIIDTVKFNRSHGKDALKHLNATKIALLSYVSVFNIIGA